MEWIVGIITVLLTVYFALRSPIFRRAVFIVGGLLILFGVIAAGSIFYSQRVSEAHSQRELNAIAPSQISISNAVINLDHGSGRITGDLVNSSAHTLYSIKLHITVQDCPAPPVRLDDLIPIPPALKGSETSARGPWERYQKISPTCVTIGEDGSVNIFVTTPPGQKRQFSGLASFANMPTYSKLHWFFAIKEVRAQLSN